MGRTWRWAGKIDLTAIGVELNGLRRVQHVVQPGGRHLGEQAVLVPQQVEIAAVAAGQAALAVPAQRRRNVRAFKTKSREFDEF